MRSVLKRYSFLCYGFIALGQLWLYTLNLRTDGLYERVTLNSNEWLGSHIVLLLSAILIFPATVILKDYLNDKSKYLVLGATILTLLGTFALVCQYILDFYLISLFAKQASDSAYAALDQIQSNEFIKFLCYDLIAAWVIGQTLFIVALFKKVNYPKWALGLFILGMLMLIFGDNLHELLERLSYSLLSVALLPIFRK